MLAVAPADSPPLDGGILGAWAPVLLPARVAVLAPKLAAWLPVDTDVAEVRVGLFWGAVAVAAGMTFAVVGTGTLTVMLC